MKRVRKLTPRLLKKIINEEKRKLNRLKTKRRRRTKLTETKKRSKTSTDIKKLRILKARQKKLINEFKKTFMQRKKIKKRLIKGL